MTEKFTDMLKFMYTNLSGRMKTYRHLPPLFVPVMGLDGVGWYNYSSSSVLLMTL